MTWFIGQSLFIIAAAFLLGILVGWLIWGGWRRTATSAPAIAAAASTPTALTPEAPSSGPELHAIPDLSRNPTPEPVPAVEPEPVVAEVASEPETDLAGAGVMPAAELESEVEPGVTAAAVAGGGAPANGTGVAGPMDDLERIEGIGPAMSGALSAAGIRTYVQLAEADETALRTAIEAKGLRFAPSIVTWAQQAQLLADGDEDGFADLTRRLVAGRDEGRL